MTDAQRIPDDLPLMAADAFTEWSLPLEGRWELVSGVPVRMQAESTMHSRRSFRIRMVLERLLEGHPCTPDERVDVLCGERDIRQADVLIDCAPEAEETSDRSRAIDPVVIFEVAVTSEAIDLGGKHLMYFRHPSVQHYVAILPRQGRVAHFQRDVLNPVWMEAGDTLSLEPQPGLIIAVAELLG